VSPDGSLYIADFGSHPKDRNRAARSDGRRSIIAAEDGSELYVFSGSGRHLRTLDALTGGVLYEFTYDAKGWLATVIEKTGGTDNVTTIERDTTGNPTAIVGPYGQRTALTLDANGYIATITNPANESSQMSYSPMVCSGV